MKFHIKHLGEPNSYGLHWQLTWPDGYIEYANSHAACIHQMDRAIKGAHHHLNTSRDLF